MSTQVDLFTNVEPNSVSPAIAKPHVSRCTFMQGDCLVEMGKIEDKSVDFIFCDLPYGTTACKWDIKIPFEPLWKNYERIIKDNGAIVFTAQQPFTTDLILSNRKIFRYEIIWEKTQKLGFFNANKMPLRGHENILVFYKKLPTYNPQKTKSNPKDIGRTRKVRADRYDGYSTDRGGQYTEDGTRFPTSVLKISNWNGALFGKTENATKHPTQKPLELMEWLIKTFTNEGDTILDNCMGSGTTGVACKKLNRHFIGIEKDETFFKLAVSRVTECIG